MKPNPASGHMKSIIASLLILSIVAFTFSPLQDAEACWGDLLSCLMDAYSAYDECRDGIGVLCVLKLLKAIKSCYDAYKECTESSSS